ncbi:MAG: hypothetical protein J6582_06000 [Snodgrassella sp.]|uniref:hypothetical protein n=1 Tax=Snodgrassella sp. TaxID=2815304 RepID=UPI0025909728|nr:hypothetical protein [Snodgrassella sp.]MCO6520578.1 hypothetical protein [Snodgrassella sp.]
MIARIFNKLWKYSFLGSVLSPLIAAFLPLPDDIIEYMFVFFLSAFLFLTIVRLLFAMAAPPIVTVRMERDD